MSLLENLFSRTKVNLKKLLQRSQILFGINLFLFLILIYFGPKNTAKLWPAIYLLYYFIIIAPMVYKLYHALKRKELGSTYHRHIKMNLFLHVGLFMIGFIVAILKA